MNSTIRTFTGRLVDPFNLACSDIDIRDIAHALSNVCRFTGHVSEFYSVGQHSVLMARLVQEQPLHRQRRALLHDASEAYIADLARPVKHHPSLQVYRDLEAFIQRCIYTWADLTYPDPESLHEDDDLMLRTEQRDLMGYEGLGYVCPWHINPWTPRHAEREFLKLWEECKCGSP